MQRIALLVGIDEYQDDRINDLNCCSHYTQRTAFTLCDVLGFDEAVALTHGVTTDKVLEQLRSIGRQLKPGDLLVLFFAGHGKTHTPGGDKPDQLFLLPQADGDLLSRQVLGGGSGILSWRALNTLTDRWAGGRAAAVHLQRLPAAAGNLGAGPAWHPRRRALPGWRRVRGDFVTRRAAVQPAGNRAALAVINSCDDGEQAEELPGYPSGGHGEFTAALMADLQAAARAGRAVHADADMARRQHGRMRQLSPAHRGSARAQQPLWLGDGVLLTEPPRREAPPAPAPPPTLQPAAQPDVLLLMADFERPLAAGQVASPWDECCQSTLAKLQIAGLADASLKALAQGLVPAPTPTRKPTPVASAAPAAVSMCAPAEAAKTADTSDKRNRKPALPLVAGAVGVAALVALRAWGRSPHPTPICTSPRCPDWLRAPRLTHPPAPMP